MSIYYPFYVIHAAIAKLKSILVEYFLQRMLLCKLLTCQFQELSVKPTLVFKFLLAERWSLFLLMVACTLVGDCVHYLSVVVRIVVLLESL